MSKSKFGYDNKFQLYFALLKSCESNLTLILWYYTPLNVKKLNLREKVVLRFFTMVLSIFKAYYLVTLVILTTNLKLTTSETTLIETMTNLLYT